MRDIDDLLGEVSGVLADAGVQFSYLFGSRARGHAMPGSDTDIAIRFSPEVPQTSGRNGCSGWAAISSA